MLQINFDKSKPMDIIPIGRIAIDFNPIDNNKPLEESRTFKKYVGGSPANIAVGMAKLGKKVGFIGKVSDDQFGRFVTMFFDDCLIDTSQIAISQNGDSLGLTFTEMKNPTESSILMYRTGVADLALTSDEVSEDYIKNSKILLVSGTGLATSPSREAAFVAIEYAKKHGVKIVFDIDYREYTWQSLDEIAIYYSQVARMSDIILGSRGEFTLMEKLILPSNTSDEESAKLWHGYGSQLLIIKHGAEGSSAYAVNGETYKIKPFPTEVMKSFGGGDGYASAFLYCLLEGKSINDSLEYATASASILVSAHSCSEAMPTVKEIEAFIAEKKAVYGEDVVWKS